MRKVISSYIGLCLFLCITAITAFADEIEEKQNTFEYVTVDASSNKGESKVIFDKANPGITISKWNGEAALKFKYPSINDTAIKSTDQKIEWASSTQKINSYPIAPTAKIDGMEDGGLEIEIILTSHPATNIFTFTLEGYENLDFLYQAPFNEEDHKGDPRCVASTETQCFDANGNQTHTRPLNVVGSYAIYNKTKRDFRTNGINYQTGKAYHIYRPQATDANGIKAWCDLKYIAGNISITVPQKFLDTALYPVTIDPTIGSGGAGASADGINNYIGAIRSTAPANGDGTTAGTYNIIATTSAGTLTFMGAVYTDGGSDPSGKGKISGNAAVSVTGGKNTYSASISGLPAFVSGTDYYLSVNGQANGTMYYDSGGTVWFKARTHSNDMPDPWPSLEGSFSGTYAIYITYTSPGITLDAASNSGYQAAQSTYTFNRTVAGSNRYLVVDVAILSAGQTVTSVVDDSGGGNVNMTFIGAQNTVTSFGRIETWGLIAPATGTKSIQVNLSSTVISATSAVSYNGVHQTSPIEGFNSAQATNVGATDATVSITSVADNCWIHAAIATSDGSITANQTSRNNVTGAGGSGADEDNNAAVTPAGATTMSYTGVGALATWTIDGVALRPIAASNLGRRRVSLVVG